MRLAFLSTHPRFRPVFVHRFLFRRASLLRAGGFPGARMSFQEGRKGRDVF